MRMGLILAGVAAALALLIAFDAFPGGGIDLRDDESVPSRAHDAPRAAASPALVGRPARAPAHPCTDPACPRCRGPLFSSPAGDAFAAHPLHGVVLDEGTGEPVPGALVAFGPESPFPSFGAGEG